jgi:hypothetical protein
MTCLRFRFRRRRRRLRADLRKSFKVVLEKTIESTPPFLQVGWKSRREFYALAIDRRNNSNDQKSRAQHKRSENDYHGQQSWETPASQPTHNRLEQECENRGDRHRQKKRLEKRQNSSSDINRENNDCSDHKERDRSDRIPQSLLLPGCRIQAYRSMLTTPQGCKRKSV